MTYSKLYKISNHESTSLVEPYSNENYPNNKKYHLGCVINEINPNTNQSSGYVRIPRENMLGLAHALLDAYCDEANVKKHIREELDTIVNSLERETNEQY